MEKSERKISPEELKDEIIYEILPITEPARQAEAIDRALDRYTLSVIEKAVGEMKDTYPVNIVLSRVKQEIGVE